MWPFCRKILTKPGFEEGPRLIGLEGMWSSPPFPIAQGGCFAADPSDSAALHSQVTMPAIKCM